MGSIENMAEQIANSIIEEKYLRKEDLMIKIKVLLKAMFDVKGSMSTKFKRTTLDHVSSVAQRNKFKSNFWRQKMEENCPEKMKQYYKELGDLLSEQDFRSNREKKIIDSGI